MHLLLPLLAGALAGEPAPSDAGVPDTTPLTSPTSPQGTFRWDWQMDLPLTVATGATWAILYFQVEPGLAPYGQKARTTGIDALVPPREDPRPAAVSDVLLYGGMGVAAATVVLDGALDRQQPGTRLLLLAETIAVNGAATETLKLAVRRPRPYTAVTDADPALLEEVDAEMSFPSGHTSFTAATTIAVARMIHASGGSTAEVAIAYGAATALTATVGTLRVTSGRHHPTDVLAGALIGGSIGWLVPMAHVQPLPGGVAVSGTF